MKPILLAVAFALIGAADFDPHQLVIPSVDLRMAATSRETCEAAIDAIRDHRWAPLDLPDLSRVEMRCERGNGFAPGEMCITGYNCR